MPVATAGSEALSDGGGGRSDDKADTGDAAGAAEAGTLAAADVGGTVETAADACIPSRTSVELVSGNGAAPGTEDTAATAGSLAAREVTEATTTGSEALSSIPDVKAGKNEKN